MNRSLSSAVLAIAIPFALSSAQQYQISRAVDGPFAFKIMGISFNQKSSLQRETILLNVPSCPVQISASSLTFSYADRGFQYKGRTTFQTQNPVSAVEIRYIVYDVFGDHLRNLSNTEAQDFAAGDHVVEGTWNVLRENDVGEHLTTVAYVAKVRLADGKVWTFQLEPLVAALRSLNLEQKMEVEDRPSPR